MQCIEKVTAAFMPAKLEPVNVFSCFSSPKIAYRFIDIPLFLIQRERKDNDSLFQRKSLQDCKCSRNLITGIQF